MPAVPVVVNAPGLLAGFVVTSRRHSGSRRSGESGNP